MSKRERKARLEDIPFDQMTPKQKVESFLRDAENDMISKLDSHTINLPPKKVKDSRAADPILSQQKGAFRHRLGQDQG